MNKSPRERLKLGMSACLTGAKVLYDGDDARNDFLINLFSPHFELVPICPKLEAGLPVPDRPCSYEATKTILG